MQDGQIPTSRLITFTLWMWVGVVLVAAWSVWFAGYHELGAMFGFTACASSAVAATSQIRCYTLRVCGLLRAIHGLDSPRTDLHSIR